MLNLLTIDRVKTKENDILTTISEKYSRSNKAKHISKWDKDDNKTKDRD
jgi:hypothetical protein